MQSALVSNCMICKGLLLYGYNKELGKLTRMLLFIATRTEYKSGEVMLELYREF